MDLFRMLWERGWDCCVVVVVVVVFLLPIGGAALFCFLFCATVDNPLLGLRETILKLTMNNSLYNRRCFQTTWGLCTNFHAVILRSTTNT